MDASEKAVLEAARERAQGGGVVTLASGVRVRLRAVAAGLLESVLSRIPDPPVPTTFVESKGAEMPNPFDPDYVAALNEAGRKRVKAASDTTVLMGFDLVDGVPPDKEWLPKLRMLEAMGHFSLSEYDLKDWLVREFVFKRYIAVAPDEIGMAMNASSIRKEAVEQAARSFQGDEARGPDTGAASQE